MSLAKLKPPKRVLLSTRPIGEQQAAAELVLDATIQEVHSSTAELSSQSVESGSDLADHYRIKPRKLRLQGVVSNTPVVTPFTKNQSAKAEDAFRTLVGWQDSATLVYVRTGLDVYADMGILSCSVTRDKDTANAIHVDLDLQQVVTVSSARSKITLKKRKPKTERGSEKETQQRVATEKASSDRVSVASESLQRLFK